MDEENESLLSGDVPGMVFIVKKENTQVFSTYTSRFGLSVAKSGQMFGTETDSFEGLITWRLPLSISAGLGDMSP